MSPFDKLTKFVKTHIDAVSSSCIIKNNKFTNCNQIQHALVISVPEDIMHIYDIMMSYALNCEKACPTSSKIFFKNIANRNCTSVNKRNISNKFDIIAAIKENCDNQIAIEILDIVLNSISKNTQLKLENFSGNNAAVIIESGQSKFSLSRQCGKSKIYSDVHVGCIDGHIQDVYEIACLLDEIIELPNKQFVLVCRGMSDDVRNTINHNNDIGKFDISVIEVPIDPYFLNSIFDIAILVNSKVISSHSGDIISSLTLSKCGKAKKCTFDSHYTRIVAYEEQRSHIEQHITYLKNMMNQMSDESAFIYSGRIANLSTNLITVRLPDANNIAWGSVKNDIDLGFRIIISSILGGFDPDFIAANAYSNFLAIAQNSV